MTSIFDLDENNKFNEELAVLPRLNLEFTKLLIEEISQKPAPNIIGLCSNENGRYMIDDKDGLYEIRFFAKPPEDMLDIMIEENVSHVIMQALQHLSSSHSKSSEKRIYNGYTIYICNFDPFGSGGMVYTGQLVEKTSKKPLSEGHFSYYINCRYTKQEDVERYPNLAKLINCWQNIDTIDDSCELTRLYSTTYHENLKTMSLK